MARLPKGDEVRTHTLQQSRTLRLVAVAILGVLFTMLRLGMSPAGASIRHTTTTPTCHGFVATIVGTSGDDTITGTAGPDVIVARGGNDVVHGGGGNDVICGGGGSDTLDGGSGDDTEYGGGGSDDLQGDDGNDTEVGGAGDDDLQGEFAASQDAGDLAILVVRAAINAVGNQHGPAIFQTPHRPGMGQPTIAVGGASGIYLFGPFRLRDLVGAANTAASPFGFVLAALLAAGRLAFLFGTQGKGLSKLGWPGRGRQLLLQFRDPLLKFGVAVFGSLQFTLQSRDQLDQPMSIDPAGA